MNNDKLVLKDGTEIKLETSQGMENLNVVTKSKQEACNFWEKFTSDNLKQVIVKNQDGITVGNYNNMILDHFRGIEKADGTILAVFSLRNKSDIEIMAERLSAVETNTQINSEAIGDVGEAISDIVEGGVQ